MFLKKLHIKILSVALLVTLISYNSFETRALPKQFISEYVVHEVVSESLATYSLLLTSENSSSIGYTIFDFEKALNFFNTEENVRFKVASFKSENIKKTRKIKSFTQQIAYPKDTYIAII
jgi:hypothetical protein